MSLGPQRFEVKQLPPSGGYWPYLIFLLGFMGPIIGGNGSELGRGFCVLCWVAGFVSFYIFWRKARCIIQTESNGMTCEIVRAGFRLTLGTTIFLWQDLEQFKHDNWTDDRGEILKLLWSDGKIQTFIDGEVKALHDYLHDHFPEKEKHPPSVIFG